jgi:rubrerythrin
MGPVEGLELALSKEKEAIAMYQKFYIEFPAAKEIFLFLSNEEQKHKSLIEKKIVELRTK